MLISLAIALVLTPWLSHRLLAHAPVHPADPDEDTGRHRLFGPLMRPFLGGDGGRHARALLYAGLTGIIIV